LHRRQYLATAVATLSAAVTGCGSDADDPTGSNSPQPASTSVPAGRTTAHTSSVPAGGTTAHTPSVPDWVRDSDADYHVDPDTNQWHCFACGSGGGPLEMAAIMARTMQCRNAQQGSLDRLSDEEFLRTCLHARDEVNGFTADMTPPYRALVAIASLLDLTMDDPERRILGRATYSIAEHVFKELSLDELEDIEDDL